jgi:uncharacterized protein involved in type VI secretion and phage assembly
VKTVNGVEIGIVANTNDPAGEGRLQLHFPTVSPTVLSAWAPVATFLAGPDRGAFFMPEVGDQVLVAFLRGSFEHPYVVGFLWDGGSRPPESDIKNRVILTPGNHTLRFEDGNNKKIVIKSSSGHEITLDDSAGSPSITIKTAGSQQIVLADTPPSIKLVGGGRSIEMSNGMVQIT